MKVELFATLVIVKPWLVSQEADVGQVAAAEAEARAELLGRKPLVVAG